MLKSPLMLIVPDGICEVFLIPPVDDLFHLISLCNKCFRGCFPPFMATFFDVGFKGTLLSG